MDVVLVSGRARGDGLHPSRARAAALARGLAAAGHRVRWLCPVPGPAQRPTAADGIEVLAVPSRGPSFRAVQPGLTDFATEQALSLELRRRLPDAVHALAYGGASSAQVPWVCERLGVRAVVSLEARELLCHRGTLIDETGAACAAWDRPERCAECCAVPFAGGLTPAQARRAAALRWLSAWSPYPQAIDFHNRADVLIGGLTSAAFVLVASDDEREWLARAGVSAPVLVLPREPDPAELVRLYERARARG